MAMRLISRAATHRSPAMKDAFLDESTDDLLDEKGIAGRLLEDPIANRLGQLGDLQQVLDQALRLVGPQRDQRELGEAMRIVPLRVEAEVPGSTVVIRSGRHQDHEGQQLRQLAEDDQDLDGRRPPVRP